MAEPGDEAMQPLLMEGGAREQAPAVVPSPAYVVRFRCVIHYMRTLYFCLMGDHEFRFNQGDQAYMRQRLDTTLQAVMDARRAMAEAGTPADFDRAQATAFRRMNAVDLQRRQLEALEQTVHLMEGLGIPPRG